jgi:NAD(P)-dependent dehydrogenase (short-subunit alcohol dehydrogenase family)
MVQQPEKPVKAEPGQVILRHVPTLQLRPRLELCQETGIKLEAGSRVLVIKDHAGLAEALVKTLEKRQVKVTLMGAASPEASISQDGPFDGIFFLPAFDSVPPLDRMSLSDWQAFLDLRIYNLFTILRALSGQPFLVCATRLGGLCGYGALPAGTLGGGTRGFTKALQRERGSFVKVVDFELDVKPSKAGGQLVDETLRDPGALEVGRKGGQRFTLGLIEEPLPSQTNFDLPPGSVYLVSGGTGGITGPVVLDLARSFPGSFYLLGRGLLPSRTNPDLLRIKTGRDLLKKEWGLPDGNGKKPTPVEVEARLAALERAAATLETIDALEKLGSKAVYLTCNVTDFSSVSRAVQTVLASEQRIDVLIHAAGFESSHRLERKSIEEFHQTLAVKATGFFHLYKALEEQGRLPRAVIGFTSIAGWFGNTGQTDYSAANDLLCKLVSALCSAHPEIKGRCLDWGPWAEVGMASRGHIPALMKMAGVEMLQPAAAAPLVRTELLAGDGCEVLLTGSLGMQETQEDPSGGLDLEGANRVLAASRPHKMLDRFVGFEKRGNLCFEVELDPRLEPFLNDHRLNGISLMPGVMGIEGFLEIARLVAAMSLEKKPFTATRLEEIQFLAPVKFYRDQPRRLTWMARVGPEGDGMAAHISLESDLELRSRPKEHLLHFSGKVILDPPGKGAQPVTGAPPEWDETRLLKKEEIYQLFSHGPAFQVLDGVCRSKEGLVGRLQLERPPLSADFTFPVNEPSLVELCMQTAGVWQVGKIATLGLPLAIQGLRFYPWEANPGLLFAQVRPATREDGQMAFDAAVVDEQGRLYLQMNGFRMASLPYTADAELLRPLQTLVGA